MGKNSSTNTVKGEKNDTFEEYKDDIKTLIWLHKKQGLIVARLRKQAFKRYGKT